MNEAFGNPKGDFTKIDTQRVLKQCKNVFDEYVELLKALGLNEDSVNAISSVHNDFTCDGDFTEAVNILEVRDALCDIQVFAQGAQHFMGVDGDDDMDAVVDGVMTRFVKDDDDLTATVQMHKAKGVHKVYFEGKYPTMVVKSAVDQPDAPKGKFLKSASYKATVFPDPALKNVVIEDSQILGAAVDGNISQLTIGQEQ